MNDRIEAAGPMAHLLMPISMFAGFCHGVVLLALLEGRGPGFENLWLWGPGVAVLALLNWLTYRGKQRRAAGSGFWESYFLTIVVGVSCLVGVGIPASTVLF